MCKGGWNLGAFGRFQEFYDGLEDCSLVVFVDIAF